MNKKIAIACDHAGLVTKAYVKAHPAFEHVQWQDLGVDEDRRVDYPDYAKAVAQAVQSGTAEVGVLICGSGIGMCITANRFRGIRAAMIYSAETAALSRQHNDANIACFGSRTQPDDQIVEWLQTFLEASFEEGRHSNRIRKIEGDSDE